MDECDFTGIFFTSDEQKCSHKIILKTQETSYLFF